MTVAFEFTSGDVGHDFFVSRTNAVVSLVPVNHAQQLGAVFLPTPGFLPEFSGVDGRHQDFQRAGIVHFLADNGIDFSQHTVAERHPAIQPGAESANEARS